MMTLEEAQKKFTETFSDERERFNLYQDMEIKAIKSMILTTEKDQKEYERLLTIHLEDLIYLKNLSKS